MKYPYIVNKDGNYYPAGIDVPVGVDSINDKKAEEIKEKNFLDEFAENLAKEEVAYTKTEINRMSTADLKELAKENGIDNSLSGAEIKKELIRKYEL